MAGFLLDTNHLGEALRPVSRVRDRIGQLHVLGVRVATCVPVLCELEAGFPSGKRGDAFRRALRRLLGRAPIYGEIFKELRGRGAVLSQVGMLLAALASQMNVTLATTDGDFKALPDVRTENWLPT